MRDNNFLRWSHGLLFVQRVMNISYHEATRVLPYKALFRVRPIVGLKTYLPAELLENVKTGIEEELLKSLIQMYLINYDIIFKINNKNILFKKIISIKNFL